MRSTIWWAGTAALALGAPAVVQKTSSRAAETTDLGALAAAAEEGVLTIIALPHGWRNHGAVIEGFRARYPGIEVNELNPDGSSADELEAVRANRGNAGPQASDVLDLGLSFGPAGEGLPAPYPVATWDTIPAEAKDPEGFWTGDGDGVVCFAVNADLVGRVPTSFADLLDPAYEGRVALAGDPRTAQNA